MMKLAEIFWYSVFFMKYLENKITKNICITVMHDALNVEVDISCDDKIILNKFLDKLNNLISK